jgi:type II secretory pathway predicted ATPase ExeA
MSYLQHFSLKHDPLGKNIRSVVHSTQENQLKQKLNWLLQTKGVGLITGEAGTGKTTVLREWVSTLNPMTHHVIYQADNHFQAFDIYSQFAEHLGLEKYARYSTLWRALKRELINLTDNKQLSPIWILDEAHLVPFNFLTELPAFLNFSFDNREIMTIILVGQPPLQATLKKSIHSALHSRIIFQFSWQTIDNFVKFSEFVLEAFKNAGIHHSIVSQSGLQLVYTASKGKLRYAHRIFTTAFQKATDINCNHLSDEILQKSIEELAQ